MSTRQRKEANSHERADQPGHDVDRAHRDTYAELDPVPDDVLAAARAAHTTIRKQTLTAGGSDA